MIDLEHGSSGQLGQSHSARVVAGAEQHDLTSATGDEFAHGIVDHARAHLHVQDPLLERARLGERFQLLDACAQLRIRECGAVWIARELRLGRQQLRHLPRSRYPRRGAARRVISHAGFFESFRNQPRGRSTIL